MTPLYPITKNRHSFCLRYLALTGAALLFATETKAGNLTIGNYTGPIPAMVQGEFNHMPGASASGGPGSTIVATSMGTGGTLAGGQPGQIVGNYLNTGFGADISLTVDPGETFNYQSLSFYTGHAGVGFDDGIRVDYNGTTVLDFDFGDYGLDPEVLSLFNVPGVWDTWEPWFNAGEPEVIFDDTGLRLMVTAASNGTGDAAGVMAGDRINILEYFIPPIYVPNPGAPDFINGVNLAVYNRNNQGNWAIAHPTITAIASAVPIPEPSAILLSGFGLAGLLLRRRRD